MNADCHLSEVCLFLVFSFYSWGNREEVWRIMLNKEKTYLRDEHFLQRHPLLQARMRAVLLDWLMEVSLTVPVAGAPPLLDLSVLLQSLRVLICIGTFCFSEAAWYKYCDGLSFL